MENNDKFFIPIIVRLFEKYCLVLFGNRYNESREASISMKSSTKMGLSGADGMALVHCKKDRSGYLHAGAQFRIPARVSR